MADSVTKPPDLPAYLRRYPHWGGLEHRWEKGQENLHAAVAWHRFGYASLSFDELQEAVHRIGDQPAGGGSVLVGEIVDRLDTFAPDDVERLVGVLFDIQQRDQPRRTCLLVDRALQRLMFLLPGPGAHDLAFACVCSERVSGGKRPTSSTPSTDSTSRRGACWLCSSPTKASKSRN